MNTLDQPQHEYVCLDCGNTGGAVMDGCCADHVVIRPTLTYAAFESYMLSIWDRLEAHTDTSETNREAIDAAIRAVGRVGSGLASSRTRGDAVSRHDDTPVDLGEPPYPDEASFMAAAEKIRDRLADAIEAGILQTRDVEGVARLSCVLAGDAILAAIGSVEGW